MMIGFDPYEYQELAASQPAMGSAYSTEVGLSYMSINVSGAVDVPIANGITDPDEDGDHIPDYNPTMFYDYGLSYDGGNGAFNNSLCGFSMEIHGNSENLVEEFVLTGRRVLQENELVGLLVFITPTVTDDLALLLADLAFDETPHIYIVKNEVGDTACDVDEAWAAVKKFAAPGQIGDSYTGKIVDVPGLGQVTQVVDEATMTVKNMTLEGHLLYPGIVERHVVVNNGHVYIETTGLGAGLLSQVNVALAPALWGAQDSRIAQYVDANDNGPGDC